MNRTTKLFAANLRGLLERNGLSQSDFTAKTNTPQPTASMWFNGIKLPRPEALEMIAAFFGVHVADLFAEPDLPPRIPKSEASDLMDMFSALNDKSRTRLLAYAQALKDMQGK